MYLTPCYQYLPRVSRSWQLYNHLVRSTNLTDKSNHALMLNETISYASSNIGKVSIKKRSKNVQRSSFQNNINCNPTGIRYNKPTPKPATLHLLCARFQSENPFTLFHQFQHGQARISPYCQGQLSQGVNGEVISAFLMTIKRFWGGQRVGVTDAESDVITGQNVRWGSRVRKGTRWEGGGHWRRQSVQKGSDNWQTGEVKGLYGAVGTARGNNRTGN